MATRFTAAQLDTIEKAFAEGAESVKIGERTITYTPELWKRIQQMRAELGVVDVDSPGPLVFNTMSYDGGAR